MTLGTELKRIRLEKGFSQPRLARRCALEHSYISRLETGSRRPRRGSLERIMNALDCTDTERRHLLAAAGFHVDGPQDARLSRLTLLIADANPVLAAYANRTIDQLIDLIEGSCSCHDH